MAAADSSVPLFVYGTLIHPHILARVLSGSLRKDDSPDRFAHLTFRSGVLNKHELRRVKGQEYPALVASQQEVTFVRGVVIYGLTTKEIRHLDRFEGDEYQRVGAAVLIPESDPSLTHLERSKWSEDEIQKCLETNLSTDSVQSLVDGTLPSRKVQVETYLWASPQDELERADGPRGPWDFANFAKSKSQRWTKSTWEDYGGPDGVVDTEEAQRDIDLETPSTPIAQPRAQGGMDEIRRAMEHGGGGSTSSMSSLSIPMEHDPWADPPRSGSARQTPAAHEDSSSNPWAMSASEAHAEPSANGAASASTLDRQAIPPGYPLHLEGQEVPGYERFGKPVRRWFFHGGPNDRGSYSQQDGDATPANRFLSFNSGFSGSCPKPVMDAYIALSKKAEECPDVFERRTVRSLMLNLRTRVASMVNCPVRELVLIRNTTAGTNAIIRGYRWEKGDCVIHLNTLYGAVINTLQYMQDSNDLSSPERIVVNVTYPIAHDDLVKQFTTVLIDSLAQGKKIKMACLEVISSRPGFHLPWQQLVQVCRDHGVLSLVDGAHSFGHVPLDLSTAQPDYFVSTVHKWAFAHRGAGFMCVPVRNQHLVPSAPTSWGYRSKSAREAEPEAEAGDDFLTQWAETGALDYSPVLSLDAALNFREKLGGEERIQRYNNSLALLGGLKICQHLDVQLLETSPQPMLSNHMINFPLPITSRVIGGQGQEAVSTWLYKKGGEAYIWETLFDEFHTAVTVYPFQGQILVRATAQVWLDLDDFDYLGRALKEICRRINAGEADLKKG